MLYCIALLCLKSAKENFFNALRFLALLRFALLCNALLHCFALLKERKRKFFLVSLGRELARFGQGTSQGGSGNPAWEGSPGNRGC